MKRLINRIFGKEIFCEHDYVIVNETILKSEIELLKDIGLVPKTHCSAKRKLITDFKCTKCNKIHRKIVKSV